MKGIYNPKKLTTDRERFHKIRVLNIGAGAVGSAAVEHEAKLCLSLDVIDDDRFEPDNAAKRSCLVRTPEDDGSNKALCLGHRSLPAPVLFSCAAGGFIVQWEKETSGGGRAVEKTDWLWPGGVRYVMIVLAVPSPIRPSSSKAVTLKSISLPFSEICVTSAVARTFMPTGVGAT